MRIPKTASLTRLEQPAGPSRRYSRWPVRLILAALCLMAAAAYGIWCVRGPSVVLLTDHGPAHWIRPRVAFFPRLRLNGLVLIHYRAPIDVPPNFAGTDLQLTALRKASVWLDTTPLARIGPVPANWKQPIHYRLPAHLAPGRHLLRIAVTNCTGPALLRAGCPALSVFTNDHWEMSLDGQQWLAAALVTEPESFSTSALFSPPPSRAISMAGPALLLLILALMLAGSKWFPAPGRLRIILIALWLVLAATDMFTVPTDYGFDAQPHMDYLNFILNHHRLPLGTDGWQLFQTPLFYLLTVPLWALLKSLASAHASAVLVRIVPIACGGVMIELVYRTLLLVFPARPDLQRVGLIAGGMLPVNLYMMQFPSNEPFMAVMAAAMVWSVCRWLARPNLQRPWQPALLTGLLLGLAILSKVSAIIWALPVAIAYAAVLWPQPNRIRQIAKAWGAIALMVMLVAGWWFVRNQIEMGVPLMSHSGGGWWQDPGYRVPADLYCFGAALTHPIVVQVRSIWDCLYGTFWGDALCSGVLGPNYRPPWNPRLMLLTDWFALLPTALMLLAALFAVFAADSKQRTYRRFTLFAVLGIGCFLVAILNVFLTLPIYSCAKASYMISATPCFAILAAGGFDYLPTWSRKPVLAWFITTAALGYASFFAIG